MNAIELSARYRCVFLKNLRLSVRIGVFDSEREKPQPVCLNITVWIDEKPPRGDALDEVYDYRQLAAAARSVFTTGHIGLQETAVERIAEVLLKDPRVQAVRVRSEKTAVIAEADGIGVEILRTRQP